jgi:hypothetical protein
VLINGYLYKILTKIIPDYAIWPAGLVLLELVSYGGTRLVTANWAPHSPALPIDSKIPFIPEFILIDVGCYLH